MNTYTTPHDNINRLEKEKAELESEWDKLDNIPQLHWRKNKIEKRLKTIQRFIALYKAVL